MPYGKRELNTLLSYEQEKLTDLHSSTSAPEKDVKSEGPRSILKETRNYQPPLVTQDNNSYEVINIPPALDALAQKYLDRLHRLYRGRNEPESKEYVVALLYAAVYSAKAGAKCALDCSKSNEAVASDIAECRKKKIIDANKAAAKLPKVSEEKENRRCRFNEEPEINVYTPHACEEEERALRKFQTFLDGKSVKYLSKTRMEFKHNGPIATEDLQRYLTMAEMMHNRIEQERPSVPILSAASAHFGGGASTADASALLEGVQLPASLTALQNRLRLAQGPTLDGSDRLQETQRAVENRQERVQLGKRQAQEEDKEEEEEELVMPAKRQRLKEKIDGDADQSHVIGSETGHNNAIQTPVKKAETKVRKASAAKKVDVAEPTKENTPPRMSEPRVTERSPERSRAPMQESVAQPQESTVENTKPRRSTRTRAPAVNSSRRGNA